MTSNLGSQMIQSMAGSDYLGSQARGMGEVKTQFPPEFRQPHRRGGGVPRAWRRQTSGRSRRSSSRSWRIASRRWSSACRFSDAALAELAKVGFDPVYGARPLKRAIQSESRKPAGEEPPRGPLRAEGHHQRRLARRPHGVEKNRRPGAPRKWGLTHFPGSAARGACGGRPGGAEGGRAMRSRPLRELTEAADVGLQFLRAAAAGAGLSRAISSACSNCGPNTSCSSRSPRSARGAAIRRGRSPRRAFGCLKHRP